MLILYTTLLSCSTAGEVISTALYCKHRSYSPGERNKTSADEYFLWLGYQPVRIKLPCQTQPLIEIRKICTICILKLGVWHIPSLSLAARAWNYSILIFNIPYISGLDAIDEYPFESREPKWRCGRGLRQEGAVNRE